MEKRASERRHLIFYLRVFDRDAGQLLGFLGDINPDGMLLISEQPREVGQHLNIKMQFPRPLGDREFLNLEATVRWCNPDVNDKFHDIGLEFSNIDREDLLVFGELLRKFGFKH